MGLDSACPVAAMAVVFSDIHISPLIPEDSGNNYVSKTVNDVSTDAGTHASDAKNNTALTANIEQALEISQTGKVTSEVSGSSKYAFSSTISVGIEPSFPLVGSVSFETSFTMGKEVEHGWKNSEENSQTLTTDHKVGVELPPYTGVLLKQTNKTQEVVTRYNCPVAVSYRVRVIDYGYYHKDGSCKVLADFTNNSQANLKTRAITNAGYADTQGINWSKVKSDSKVAAAIDAMANNVPVASTDAKFTEKLSSVESTIDHLMPLLPLKSVRLKDSNDELTMSTGETLRVDKIALEGLNANKCMYYGFDEDYGKWILTDANGNELTDGAATEKKH